MTLFVTSIVVVLAVSAICSLSEAGFYAVRLPYIRTLSESGARSGVILSRFKENMEQPIAAILIVNTAANTAGAAVAGAQARHLFGDAALLWFSALFTLSVLLLSEIIPKVIGVVYNQPISRGLALPWFGMIRLMSPMIWVIERLTNLLKPNNPVLSAPEAEVEQMARISAEEGSILNFEADLVKNVLNLDNTTAREIMTPRNVVFKLADHTTLAEAHEKVDEWIHSRIPVYSVDDPDSWTGFVLTRDILNGLAGDDFNRTLGELAKPMFFVPETILGHVLLKAFIKRRSHLFGVTDDYGNVTGIVTLEDVVEELIGEEIVDEVDLIADMQQVALRRNRDQLKPPEERSPPNPPAEEG